MKDWAAAAACRGKPNAIFFSHEEADQAAAKAVCAGCPVKAPCLVAGKGEAGVWGGLTLAERTRTRTHKPYLLPQKPCAVCGAPFWPYSDNARYCPECRAMGLGRAV